MEIYGPLLQLLEYGELYVREISTMYVVIMFPVIMLLL